MTVETAREVMERCRTLATYSEEPGFITRTFLAESMRTVHADLSAWMRAAGMDVRIDAAGNLRGVYAGMPGAGRRLLIGSHLDTVPHAGAFDGVLGVVIGISVVASLNGRKLPFSIEVIGFSEEEGIRFGIPFIGSRAVAGDLNETDLAAQDAAGTSVRQAIEGFGLDPNLLDESRAVPDAFGYVEFHIEQGPVLDRRNCPLAVVDAIAGRFAAIVTFIGEAGHAGTTPMGGRRDAVAAAAEWICAVEALAYRTPDLVATTGQVRTEPGATNVIAGRCRVSLDVRHANDSVRTAAVERLRAAAYDIGCRRGIRVEWIERFDHPTTRMDPSLVTTMTRAVERTGVPAFVMTSGAGHDAMILAQRMPAAMLFVRSPGGISHHPDESVREEDVALALAAGRYLLDDLAGLSDG
jgi:allantoate deiminase